jgi:hypothetical protein
MHIEFNLEQRSVVEWSIHPQATLETFFHGMTPEQIEQYVREINLEDDFFKNLQLDVRAFTDFGDPNVATTRTATGKRRTRRSPSPASSPRSGQ